MMIVKERSFAAVLGAFAWLAVVFLWQSGVFEAGSGVDREPERSVTATQVHRVATTSAAWYD